MSGRADQQIEETKHRETSRAFKEVKCAELARQAGYGVVESFCGAGGLSLGLGRAGFRLLYAFDADARAVETYRENLGDHCDIADVRTLLGADLLAKLGLAKGALALFSGGPPCQGFSKQKRNAHKGDSRNDLVLEFARLVRELEPRFFLFENVVIFGQKRGRGYVDLMSRELASYRLYPHFYITADYGPAQTRHRFIMVGRRLDQACVFRVPRPSVTRWRTVRETIGDLPEPPEDFTDHPDYPNHQRARVTEINIRRFSLVPPGGGWKDIPEDLRLQCHKGVDTSSGGWPDVYGRLEWDGQCPTITGGFDSFTRGRYGHPDRDRPLTPREAARLQGFPDTFVFRGTRAHVRSQIGNAVPPPLAQAVGTEIIRCLLVADGLLKNDQRSPESGQQLTLF